MKKLFRAKRSRAQLLWLLVLGLVVGTVTGLIIRSMIFGGPAREAAIDAEVGIGVPFVLTDHRGRSVTDADYRGRLLLVYFGYTLCPGSCAADLQDISLALERLGTDAEQLQPLFITVDPERDTVEELAAYVGLFHPRLVGLTGRPEDIAAVAQGYGITYARAEPQANAGAGDYLIEHAAAIYLMDREGRFLTRFPSRTPSDVLADGIRGYL